MRFPTFISRTTTFGIIAAAMQLSAPAFAGHILSGINMHGCELVLINADTDQLAKVALPGLQNWRPAACQHTAISHDEKTVYVTTDALPPSTAGVITIRLNNVDWDKGTINASILQTIDLDPPGSPSKFPVVAQTSPAQPIMPWTRPPYTQTHAPTYLPKSNLFFLTHYTDDRIREFEVAPDGTLKKTNVYSNGDLTRQMHGVNFNADGTVGLGVGYDYDMTYVRVFKLNRANGKVDADIIPLGERNAYGAFAHYAVWLNSRYAYIGTMQAGPTSLTKAGTKILSPSVWLIDVRTGKATRVIASADEQANGLIRSPSDVAIARGKLYVAEEDSWGKRPGTPPNAPASEYGRDGYVSIWDISNPARPRFIKRLAPGAGLPSDFRNAHTASALVDEDAVFVSSFVSDYMVKIDTATDTVTKVYSMEDGLNMFHGEFAAGRNR